ncbi:hypothetical protein TAMYLO_510002 [Tenacibaculum amylolyticum]
MLFKKSSKRSIAWFYFGTNIQRIQPNYSNAFKQLTYLNISFHEKIIVVYLNGTIWCYVL